MILNKEVFKYYVKFYSNDDINLIRVKGFFKMGILSYLCEVSKKQIRQGSWVRLYLLKEGEVVEEMRGTYSASGGVNEVGIFHEYLNENGEIVPVTETMVSEINSSGHPWVTKGSSEIVDMHTDKNQTHSGVVCVLDRYVDMIYTPSRISECSPT
jgi:hypothetical protein